MMQRTEEMVKERLHDIRKTVEEAAAISGRSSDDVSVMAVTKTVPPVLVNAAIAEGITLLGENRAQELLEKYADYHLDLSLIHISVQAKRRFPVSFQIDTKTRAVADRF